MARSSSAGPGPLERVFAHVERDFTELAATVCRDGEEHAA